MLIINQITLKYDDEDVDIGIHTLVFGDGNTTI